MPYADPDQARNYQREYRALRRAGDCRTTPRTATVPGEFRMKTAGDVLAILREQVASVRADEKASALEKARCIGYLAAVSLRAIEAGNVAARVDALETALGLRPPAYAGFRLAESGLEESLIEDEALEAALAELDGPIDSGEDEPES